MRWKIEGNHPQMIVELNHGEKICMNSNCIIAASSSINFAQSTNGSVIDGIKSALSGGKMFMQYAIANTDKGTVYLGNKMPGEIQGIKINESATLYINKNCFLMSSSNISFEQNLIAIGKKLMGKSTEFCKLNVHGEGVVGLISCGSIIRIDDPDLLVNPDNLVAYSGSNVSSQKVSGLFSRLTKSELNLVKVSGGTLWIQTRGAEQFIGWLLDNNLVMQEDIKNLQDNISKTYESSEQLNSDSFEDTELSVVSLLNSMSFEERKALQARLISASKKGISYRNSELDELIKEGYPAELLGYLLSNLSFDRQNKSGAYSRLMNIGKR